jgi:cytochrome c biogenesis protein CcdA
VLSLAIAVVAIALPDCINPSLIAAQLLLAAGQHPARRTTEFALAVFTVTLLVGFALALGLGDLILSVVPKPGATVKYALFTAAGVVLVVGGTFVWIRRKALGGSGPSRDGADHSRGSPVLIGAGIAALELLTAFPYFAAIAMIAGSSVGTAGKVSLLVLYCAVYTLPLIGIAVVCAVMGQRAEAFLRPVVNWLFARWPLIVGPLAAVIGVGLAAYGIVRLSST